MTHTLSRDNQGFLWAMLGVLMFSLSLPATKAAVTSLDGWTVGIGRAVVAAVLAAAVLGWNRERLPQVSQWGGLAMTALGVVFGFPICSSIALQSVPSSHGAVVNGLLPAVTAVAAVLFAGERPRWTFWLVSALGVVAVMGFAAVTGAGNLQAGDLWMLAAVVLGAVGYAEGGRLSKAMGGWKVICWALVFSLPLALLLLLLRHPLPHGPLTLHVWLGFAYVSLFSMLLGFFAWYHGLALGGIARAGQSQLAQPVLTVLWSALLLGETLQPLTLLAAFLIMFVVLLSRLTRG